MMRAAGTPHLKHAPVLPNQREVPLGPMMSDDEKEKSLLESEIGLADDRTEPSVFVTRFSKSW